MIDVAELFEKIESKQFEIDYNNNVTKSIEEYSKAEGKIEALECVKRLIAERNGIKYAAQISNRFESKRRKYKKKQLKNLFLEKRN